MVDTGAPNIVLSSSIAEAIFTRIHGAFPIVSKPVPGFQSEPGTFYAYPCDSDSQISFVIGGREFDINPLDLDFGRLVSQGAVLDPDGTLLEQFGDVPGSPPSRLNNAVEGPVPYCLASINGGGNLIQEFPLDLIILGTPFLKNWYSIYSMTDPPTVSFAAAKLNQDVPAGDLTNVDSGVSTATTDFGTAGEG